MFSITFVSATVSRCNYIGQTKYGVCAVVLKNGIEVFRSGAHSKRYLPRVEAEAFIAGQA